MRVEAPSSVARKHSKQLVDVEVEEVIGPLALEPTEIFYRYYFPPRMDDAPSIVVPMNEKYPLPKAPISKGVRQDEDMLGKVVNLEFMDHEITDT